MTRESATAKSGSRPGWKARHPFRNGQSVFARRDFAHGRLCFAAGQALTVALIGEDAHGAWFSPEGGPLVQLPVDAFTADRNLVEA